MGPAGRSVTKKLFCNGVLQESLGNFVAQQNAEFRASLEADEHKADKEAEKEVTECVYRPVAITSSKMTVGHVGVQPAAHAHIVDTYMYVCSCSYGEAWVSARLFYSDQGSEVCCEVLSKTGTYWWTRSL